MKAFKNGKLVVIVIGKKQDKNEFVDVAMDGKWQETSSKTVWLGRWTWDSWVDSKYKIQMTLQAQ